MVLTAVHEMGVQADRDCFERLDRIVPIEAKIAREVVSCPIRDADERKVALDRDLRDRGERPVAARDAQRLRRGAGKCDGIVAFAEDMDSSCRIVANRMPGRSTVAPGSPSRRVFGVRIPLGGWGIGTEGTRDLVPTPCRIGVDSQAGLRSRSC